MYFLKHQEGYILLYLNKNPNLTINEEIEFEMTNCHIDSAYGSYMNVVVKPNTEKLINFVVEDTNKDFSCRIKKMAFKVTE